MPPLIADRDVDPPLAVDLGHGEVDTYDVGAGWSVPGRRAGYFAVGQPLERGGVVSLPQVTPPALARHERRSSFPAQNRF